MMMMMMTRKRTRKMKKMRKKKRKSLRDRCAKSPLCLLARLRHLKRTG